MGQQQLLLLILAAVIVGIAITVGINMFAQNSVQANQEAVVQDVLTVASRAQAWYRKPVSLGGGGRTYTGISLDKINFKTPNANGGYTITGAANTADIVGTGVEDGGGAVGPLTVKVTVGADTISAALVTP